MAGASSLTLLRNPGPNSAVSGVMATANCVPLEVRISNCFEGQSHSYLLKMDQNDLSVLNENFLILSNSNINLKSLDLSYLLATTNDDKTSLVSLIPSDLEAISKIREVVGKYLKGRDQPRYNWLSYDPASGGSLTGLKPLETSDSKRVQSWNAQQTDSNPDRFSQFLQKHHQERDLIIPPLSASPSEAQKKEHKKSVDAFDNWTNLLKTLNQRAIRFALSKKKTSYTEEEFQQLILEIEQAILKEKESRFRRHPHPLTMEEKTFARDVALLCISDRTEDLIHRRKLGHPIKQCSMEFLVLELLRTPKENIRISIGTFLNHPRILEFMRDWTPEMKGKYGDFLNQFLATP